jgi:hypothetical protein
MRTLLAKPAQEHPSLDVWEAASRDKQCLAIVLALNELVVDHSPEDTFLCSKGPKVLKAQQAARKLLAAKQVQVAFALAYRASASCLVHVQL